MFKDKQLVVDDTRALTSNYYFHDEMLMLLDKAGFAVEFAIGDLPDEGATADHNVIVYFARK